MYVRGVTEQGEESGRRFGVNLRAAREGAGLSGTAVAGEMRRRGYAFHQQTISRLESGEQVPKLFEAVDLADIVGASLDDLMRPADLERAARAIMAAARKAREGRRAVADITARYEYDADRLRQLLDEVRENGTADRLRNEIRAGMAALGDEPGSDRA
jgi:transcriptional regulator with XRE-family HTH domain